MNAFFLFLKAIPKPVKITIIIILVVAVLLLVVYFKGKNKGKDEAAIDTDQLQTPSDNDPQLTDKEKIQVSELAKTLYEEMDGTNFYRTIKPFKDLNSLGDRMFVPVLNDFNVLVIKNKQNDKGNFRQWLTDEWMYGTDAYVLRETLMERMDRLGIKAKTKL
jgi:hypothetical protein